MLVYDHKLIPHNTSSSTMGLSCNLEVVFGFVPYTAFLELTSRPKAKLPGKEYVDL